MAKIQLFKYIFYYGYHEFVSPFFIFFLATTVPLAAEDFQCADSQKYLSGAAAKPILGILPFPIPQGQVHALVVFAKFSGEAPANDQAPDYATALFDPDLPGSLAHFYRTMSSGQLRLHGEILAQRYTSERPASAYLAPEAGEWGDYGAFAREILRQVDGQIDFARFDNDGPDGMPASGDDDGRVDYIFLNLLSIPRHFLLGGATGVPVWA